MNWTNKHRKRLYKIIESKWADLEIEPFEQWLASLGIEWAELKEIHDAPEGTVAIWEGPGPSGDKLCWVIPDEVAMKMLILGIP